MRVGPGQFGVFGYATKGLEVLPQVQSGDVIKTARIVSGLSKLQVPEVPADAQ